jgi:hypothetical protein
VESREATLRGLLAEDVLREIGAALTERGVPWVTLKGAALHALAVRTMAERTVSDLDVLVDPARLRDALEAAAKAGFVAGPRDAVTVTCVRAGTPLPLDVHFRLFEPGLFRLEAEGVLSRAGRVHDVCVPAPLDIYGHLVGHFVKGRLRPKDRAHLGDFGALSRKLGLDVDAVAAHLARHGLARAARYPLRLAHTLEGDGFAGNVLRALPRDPLGDALAAVSRRVLASNAAAPLGALAANALNDTLVRGAASYFRHGARSAARTIASSASRGSRQKSR